MNKIAGIALVAVIAAALAWWVGGRYGDAQESLRRYPQTIRYTIQSDRVAVEIETPRWPGEAMDDWMFRNSQVWLHWEQVYGEAVYDVDCEPGASEDHGDPGD